MSFIPRNTYRKRYFWIWDSGKIDVLRRDGVAGPYRKVGSIDMRRRTGPTAGEFYAWGETMEQAAFDITDGLNTGGASRERALRRLGK